ncbi:uracil/xanthine transporter [Oceanobacillus luteolus]|uniref:uracil/xanthine transporter n=1 Tax=Oceanobacillus luteolus TaxID=1274358 RepID=UPI00203FF8CF|nr:uracil/xanthine transporter [Oceanobacillus luteolus]MCM3741293.1 uracil/xanthine transporter [Oceanobacillus luteolus]
MKNELTKMDNWLGGLQWLMYIFVNTVVVPITIGAAFELSQEQIVSTMQFSFILGGIACLLQVFIGHGRPIMDGPSGLWWGVIIALSSMSVAQGIPIAEVGGSIAVGVIITGVLTILVGITGFGYYLEKLFNPSVMGVFMLLFGVSLCINFVKGMLGIPYGGQVGDISIKIGPSILAIAIAALVLILTIKGSNKIAQYSMLIGIVIGWPLFALLFSAESQLGGGEVPSTLKVFLFPTGEIAWNIGIIATVIVTGILNLSKQYGSIKGTDIIYTDTPSTAKHYRNSFSITGVMTILSGVLGLVPYSPFVSSIGFIQQTKIYERMPFIFGSVMFFILGIIPQVGYFFTLLPLSIGSAVLFVSYVALFGSAMDWFKQTKFNNTNIYRAAMPAFIGLVLMALPPESFGSLPDYLQPLLSNGLLMGTTISIIMENIMNWDKIGYSTDVTGKTGGREL